MNVPSPAEPKKLSYSNFSKKCSEFDLVEYWEQLLNSAVSCSAQYTESGLDGNYGKVSHFLIQGSAAFCYFLKLTLS
jgi:hypothetical protein